MVKFGLVCAYACAAFVVRAVPTSDSPTTDGSALEGLGSSDRSPAATLQRYVDSGEIAGAVSMVAVSGKVETAYVGLADPTTGRPFDDKSLFWIASMTKGFCGAAVMSCVDRGLLSLDDPIEKYIPEIANVKVAEKGADGKTTLRSPKVKMTLRMCLSHVAGYPFSTPLAIEHGSNRISMEGHVKGAVECPLLRDPLVKHQYSNVDINLAGRVVEIVTGMPFEDYLKKTFFDPLGMKDITFYPTAEQLSNKVYVARIKNGRHYEDGRGDQFAKYLTFKDVRRGREYAIAAGGLYSTAADVMKFYLMLANDGKAPDGKRILSHSSVVELSRAQYPHLDRYTLGMRQFGDWFGHDGALQTEAYANWKENRAALLYVQVTGAWDHYFKKDWRTAALVQGQGPRLTGKIAEEHKILRTDSFYGFDRTVFDFEGYEAWIVEPRRRAVKNGFPWTWTMQWATAFVPRTGVPQLLEDGYHHATIITFKDKMDETGLAVSARFQRYLVAELGLSPKADLIGMSWGGFYSTRYAVRYPGNVDKIYLDAPLLCFRDAGDLKLKKLPDYGSWSKMTPVGGSWASDPNMPVNQAAQLAATGIPVFIVYGGQDGTCPPEQNAIPFITRYRDAGGKSIKVLFRSYFGHHPHGFDPGDRTIADFFKKPFVADERLQDILGNKTDK